MLWMKTKLSVFLSVWQDNPHMSSNKMILPTIHYHVMIRFKFRFRYYIISLSNTWFHYPANNTLLAQSQYVSILEHLGAPDHCVACRPTCLVLSSEIWMDHKIVSCELGISMSKYPTLLWLMRQRRLQQATIVCIILSSWLKYYSSLSQLLIGNEYYQVIPLHLM